MIPNQVSEEPPVKSHRLARHNKLDAYHQSHVQACRKGFNHSLGRSRHSNICQCTWITNLIPLIQASDKGKQIHDDILRMHKKAGFRKLSNWFEHMQNGKIL
ncbi:hypothetical protein GOP47_0029953 [Adiantum capillus-veneris]|nr:hypothetical protein GOP47_0029953 [Adiantum capillus-veneris]